MIETATDCIRGRVPDDALADTLSAHLAEHRRVVDGLCVRLPVVASWGAELALRMLTGGRLLVIGDERSAAAARHLADAVIGAPDRRPAFSATVVSTGPPATGATTGDAIVRQVVAHGRPGDVVMLLALDGRDATLMRAVEAASRAGTDTWALTGRAPNPLCNAATAHVALPGDDDAVQEAQWLALNLLRQVFVHELGTLARHTPAARRQG